MTTASTANSTATSILSGYTYIETLITGASAMGMYSTVVDGKYMNNTMISGLTGTYGYSVTPLTDGLGTYTR